MWISLGYSPCRKATPPWHRQHWCCQDSELSRRNHSMFAMGPMKISAAEELEDLHYESSKVLNFSLKHCVYSAFFWQMATLQKTLSTTGQKTRRKSMGWISCSLLNSQLPITSSQQKWWTSNLVTGSVFSSGTVSDFFLPRETSYIYNRKSLFLSNWFKNTSGFW